VADIDPGVAEHVLHFERKHFLIDIDVAMNLGLAHERFTASTSPRYLAIAASLLTLKVRRPGETGRSF